MLLQPLLCHVALALYLHLLQVQFSLQFLDIHFVPELLLLGLTTLRRCAQVELRIACFILTCLHVAPGLQAFGLPVPGTLRVLLHVDIPFGSGSIRIYTVGGRIMRFSPKI